MHWPSGIGGLLFVRFRTNLSEGTKKEADFQDLYGYFERFMPVYIRYINPIIHQLKSQEIQLSENQIKVLMSVNRRERVSPGELNAILPIPKTRLTTIIRSLIHLEWLYRENTRDDERKYYLRPTPSGRRIIAFRHEVNTGKFRKLFQELSIDDFETIRDGLLCMEKFFKSKEAIDEYC